MYTFIVYPVYDGILVGQGIISDPVGGSRVSSGTKAAREGTGGADNIGNFVGAIGNGI